MIPFPRTPALTVPDQRMDGRRRRASAASTDVGQTGWVDVTPIDATTSLAGRYRIVGRLGEGGMSVVWRAHDEVLDRAVAIKVLASDRIADPAERIRVQSEARAAAALTHPNVAAVHDYGQWPGVSGPPVPYVVMELVEGLCLADVLADGPVGPVEAMLICADVARGLAAVHARGLVHRDVKPGNVIVTADGAKLVDFGLAASIGEPDEADEDGIMFGTPAYLAPERLEGGVVASGSDVYALGLLLYRLLAGSTPWSAETTTQMLKAHAYLPPRPLPAVEGVPAEIAELCQRCLAKDPADRPSAAEVVGVLTAPAAGTAAGVHTATDGGGAGGSRGDGPGAGTVGSAGDEDAHHSRRRLVAVVAVLAVLVAGLVLVVVRPFGGPSGPQEADDQPAVGGTPVPDPTFAHDGGSGTPSTGPSDGWPGVAPTGSGAGTGAGRPGSTPGPPAPGPDGGTAAPGAPGATPTPDPVRRDVNSTGGSATVECVGTRAHLTAWTPASGYQTQNVQPGPNPSVHVMFRAGNTHITIRARCVDGVPDVTVTDEAD